MTKPKNEEAEPLLKKTEIPKSGKKEKSAKGQLKQKTTAKSSKRNDLENPFSAKREAPQDKNGPDSGRLSGVLNGSHVMWKNTKKRMLFFQIYYVMQVIVSVVFVAYYVLMAFKQREPYEVETLKKGADKNVQKENISSALTVAFMTGFVLHSINFTIGTFVEPCVRLTTLQSDREADKPKSYSNFTMIAFGTDVSFRLAFIIFSIGQLFLLRSDGIKQAAKDKPALAYDVNWMQALAIAQIILIPVFMAWRWNAVLDVQAPKRGAGEIGNEDDTVAERLRQEAIEVEKLRLKVREARDKYKEKERALEEKQNKSLTANFLPQSQDDSREFKSKQDKLMSVTEEFQQRAKARRMRKKKSGGGGDMLDGLQDSQREPFTTYKPNQMATPGDLDSEDEAVEKKRKTKRVAKKNSDPYSAKLVKEKSQRRSIPYKDQQQEDDKGSHAHSETMVVQNNDKGIKDSPKFKDNRLITSAQGGGRGNNPNAQSMADLSGFKNKLAEDDNPDPADSIDPSQYKSYYDMNRIKNEGLTMHGLLGSDDEDGDHKKVAVTKSRKPNHNINHENNVAPPSDDAGTHYENNIGALREESASPNRRGAK